MSGIESEVKAQQGFFHQIYNLPGHIIYHNSATSEVMCTCGEKRCAAIDVMLQNSLTARLACDKYRYIENKPAFKELSEYKQDVWMPSTDECRECSAPVEVMISNVVDGFGVMEFRMNHSARCSVGQEMDKVDEGSTLSGMVGWEYSKAYHIVLNGWQYPVYKRTAEFTACIVCKAIAINPLRVFNEKRRWEAAFCERCFKQNGIADRLMRSPQA